MIAATSASVPKGASAHRGSSGEKAIDQTVNESAFR
jgi:hypothetical protein